ncbi:hypothetical protein PEC18_29695 [Paucibacter sp. O1-1]|nr:hypothetical protein [Paucibacter sp. O1-1]MDA3829915.1 hypothetical protein [Paucibacter sp. O1-1]
MHRIIVVPRTDVTWMADVIVLIQDSWSLEFFRRVQFIQKIQCGRRKHKHAGYDTFRSERLFAGMREDTDANAQKFQFRTIYAVPYIGKTFITGQANFMI